MRIRLLPCACVVVALLWAPLTAGAQTPTPAADSNDLSRQATDPTASLMAFNFISDVRTSFVDQEGKGFEFRFQPVVPFKALGTSNILRIVVPYQGTGPGTEGLRDVTIFDLVVLPQHWGRFAVGPVMSMRQSDGSADSKFAVGPAVGAMVPTSKRLMVGLFSQNLFATETAISQLQPIVAYQLGSGWALSAGDLQFTYDWNGGGWVSIPIGFQLGVVHKVGGQPFRFSVNPQWDLADISGVASSKVVFTVTMLAPGK